MSTFRYSLITFIWLRLLFIYIFPCNFSFDFFWAFALIANIVAKFLDFLSWSFRINHIKFSRNTAFLTVDFNRIYLSSYTNWAGHFPSISCLFIIPNLKALSMEKMSTKSSHIDLLIQTNGALIVGIWQIGSYFIDFKMINVNFQLSWRLKVLWTLLIIMTSSIDNYSTKDDERNEWYSNEQYNDNDENSLGYWTAIF